MTRFKCTVAYAGADYEGWQSQKDGRSVQEQIESALEHITNQTIHITASGRTDAGVNARKQVFMFDTDLTMSPRKWMGAINGFLPKDIHIMKVEEVSPLFHARYQVRYKKYTYRVNDGPYDVFSRETACQCPVSLDFDAMQKASKIFLGTHDFTSFNSTPLSLYPDQTRTVYAIEMKRDNHLISMTFYGKGFLRYMVRFMSGALIDVGKHKISIEHVQEMMDEKNKHIPRRNAPACGLTLEDVNYYEMIALSPEVQIREFLYGDALPYEEWSLYDLMKRVREQSVPRAYAFCARNNQKLLGYLSVYQEDEIQAELVLIDKDGWKYVNDVKEQVLTWMKKNGFHGAFKIVQKDDAVMRFRADQIENDMEKEWRNILKLMA